MLIVGKLPCFMSCYYKPENGYWVIMEDHKQNNKISYRIHVCYKDYLYYYNGKLYKRTTQITGEYPGEMIKLINISPLSIKFLFNKNKVVLG